MRKLLWIAVLLLASGPGLATAQWRERLEEVAPSARTIAAALEQPLSDAELRILTEIGLLEPAARTTALRQLTTNQLLRLHVRLERHGQVRGEFYIREYDPAEYLRSEKTAVEIFETKRSAALEMIREVLVHDLAHRPPSRSKTAAIRKHLAASNPPFRGVNDLVVDALFGLPSVKEWIERENGTAGRSESLKLEDPVARGAWIGLSPGVLQTPYADMHELIRTMKLPAGSTIADMGTAYGRMGFVVGEYFPDLKFVGYEYLDYRVKPAQKAAAALGYENVRFVQADFSAPNFEPARADVYFTYWSNADQGVMQKLFDRLLDQAQRNPGMRVITRDFHPRRVNADWLVEESRLEIGDRGRRKVFDVYTVDPEKVRAAVAARAEGRERFAPPRRGAGVTAAAPISEADAAKVFEEVRNAAVADLSERVAKTVDPAERAALARGLADVKGLRLHVTPTQDILAERIGDRVLVSQGLLNEVALQAEASSEPVLRGRMLGLILGHEVAHASGVRAERVADAEGLKLLARSSLGLASDAEIQRTLAAFDRPTGSSHVDAFLNRLRNLYRYGTARGRLENLRRAGRGEPDPLARYRRSDGTLRWKPLLADRALTEVGGLAHFGLALFLKELAMVARTGDRARIDEFFDGLLTTDFYKHYGLFVAGARVGEVAYTRYLQRFVKPKFVSSLLKTNAVLAAGIALPMIYEGQFDGKAFAISVTALGLSSAAVKTGVRGISWVLSLDKARKTGILARLSGTRLARLGGWFYTAVELAVVLYIADDLSTWVNNELDERKARQTLADAGLVFARAVGDPNATRAQVDEAADAHHQAWIDYRNFLYRRLHQEESLFARRLQGVARSAKIKADTRKAALERIERFPALRANVVSRYGSTEAYAHQLTAAEEAEIREAVNEHLARYTSQRDLHMKEVYEGNRRKSKLLSGLENPSYALRGARSGDVADPYKGRTDVFARMGAERHRASAKNQLESAYKRASENRLQAYDDEAEVLAALAKALRQVDRISAAQAIESKRLGVLRLKAADARLAQGGLIEAGTEGATGRVDGLGD